MEKSKGEKTEKIRNDLENRKQIKEKQYKSAVIGFIIGDALGVPVEFLSREELKENPVEDMMGYGTYNQPAGTWSDDSSMTIATMEWLGERKGLLPDYKSLMDKFSNWFTQGDYTPYGENFGCGISTSKAINNYRKGIEPLQCGGDSEYDNGNGSLMRILPAALWHADGLWGRLSDDVSDRIGDIYNLSALTHGHERSKLACLIYSKIIADMIHMTDVDKYTVIERSLIYCKEYLDEKAEEKLSVEKDKFIRLWDVNSFVRLPEEEIKSSGYVVDTLEAAIWCFLNTDTYKECVLKAVNLGDDTDTVGAVAGGIAGLYYGIETIPEAWINIIPKNEWIIELSERMVHLD